MKRAILAVIFTALSLASFASAAHANNDGQVCFDNGTKVDVVGSHESITVTAPEGKLISGYCVKAGSIKQGLGPEYVEVDPPAASVVITHSSGKDISHYTVTYIDIEDAHQLARFVVEDRVGLAIPQGRHGDAAGVAGIGP